MTIKQFLDFIKEARENSLREGAALLEQAHEIYLKWFYWSALFAEVFTNDDWESYTSRFYMESTRITESSLVLAIHGEYKPAVQVLRDWLEGMVGGVYFDSRPDEGKLWERGEQIDFGKSIKGITKKKVVDEALRKQIGQLWGELSGYVHQKQEVGDFISSSQPFATYNEEALKIWAGFLRKAFDVCNSLLVSRFPKLLTLEETKQIMG